MKLTIATCQFPTTSDISNNEHHISKLLKEAKEKEADVAHFPECGLSGYAGADMESYDDFDWDQLRKSTKNILDLAKELNIWVILGSTHQLSEGHKPHNSLYVINGKGEIVDRYDKRFCAGDKDSKTGDLAHYTSGDHFVVFNIKGVQCGTLICHDYRYPELYREYKKLGVQLMFHSYHAAQWSTDQYNTSAAKVNAELNGNPTIAGTTQIAAMHASSSNNYMYISCPNSSAKESLWGSFFVGPDGIITGQLPRNEKGTLVTTIDTDDELYDSTVAWRDNAISGNYHSGKLVSDIRSKDRRNF